MIKDLVSFNILGLPAFAYGGMFTFLLILLQVLIGTHLLKVDFRIHRVNGFVILVLAMFHGIAALSYLIGF